MMAIINSPDQEDIIEDLNNIVFNVIEPKAAARVVWDQCGELISGGATEAFMYDFVSEQISINRQKDNK